MKNDTIPYFVIYGGEYKVFRGKLTEAEILQVIDKLADVSVLGVSDIVFNNPFQELYYEKLIAQYTKNLKAYQAKVNNGKKGGRPRKVTHNTTVTGTPFLESEGGGVSPPTPPRYDITCNPNIEKCFKIYGDVCKNLKAIRFERRSREILELVAQFLDETEYDFDYFKEVCTKANEQKTLCDNALDFKGVIKNHISISNEKFKKGNSSEMISKLKFK